MLGKWFRQLCDDRDKVLEEAGIGAKRMEDAGGGLNDISI